MNPLRDYSDVEDIVTRNWPTREAMILADGADPSRFKRLLGLTVRTLLFLQTVIERNFSGHMPSLVGPYARWTLRKSMPSLQKMRTTEI